MLLPLSVMGHRLCAKVSLGTFHVLSEDLACLEICFSTEQQQPTDQRTVTCFASATELHLVQLCTVAPIVMYMELIYQ